jgi:DNA polymerase III epsilon subunit-like protein
MIELLEQDLSSFRGAELYRPCGHNVQFDISFLLEAAKREDAFIGNDINFRKIIDTRSIYCYMDYIGRIKLPDYKLSTICDYYNIPLKAHDALEDVRAVRKLLHLLNP